MEKSERESIRQNLHVLVNHTVCDADLFTFCFQKHVLTVAQVDAISAERKKLDRAYKFYQIIQTNSNSYKVLIEALHATDQADIVSILETDVVPPTLQNDTRVRNILYEKDRSIFFVTPPDPLFTGRESELEELHQKMLRGLEQPTLISQITCISGPGGIGKSQLTRKYVQEYRSHFQDNCIWFNAFTEKCLIGSFLTLASDQLEISTKNADGSQKLIKVVVRNVYSYFENRKCLFVFDNAINTPWLYPFLPVGSPKAEKYRPTILITSRSREWDRGVEVLELSELKEYDAVAMVKNGLSLQKDTSQDDCICKLVRKLDCHPSKIREAISVIDDQQKMKPYNVDNFLKEIDNMLEYEFKFGNDTQALFSDIERRKKNKCVIS